MATAIFILAVVPHSAEASIPPSFLSLRKVPGGEDAIGANFSLSGSPSDDVRDRRASGAPSIRYSSSVAHPTTLEIALATCRRYVPYG